MPREPLLATKGIALAISDGVSSSAVSQQASEAVVRTFLEDYYCTSQAWSVKKSGRQVLAATNSWLYAQNQQSPFRFDKERGYVCTLSALVLKGRTAHIFHSGDARVVRIRGEECEPLTNEHRIWTAPGQCHLSRALGIEAALEIDYRALGLEPGDVFVLMTDGVHEFVPLASLAAAVREHAADLDAAASAIAALALERGSGDNVTVQLARLEELPDEGIEEIHRQSRELPFPPPLGPRAQIDGYAVIRELHTSARSRVYLVGDGDSRQPLALKTLATELQADPRAVERFLMEDWIARRIDSAHVLKAAGESRARHHLYLITEFIDGQTLAQWMIDNPRPDLETVRGIVEQIARGLMAFHRLEMLHQDLRPANVMIDRTGTVKLLDFGSVRVAGIAESGGAAGELLGTAQYTAPECLVGEAASPQSDQFSLGVIAYQMLCGRLPYGADVARARSKSAQRKLAYRSVLDDEREIPRWIDEVLKKAVAVAPSKRYEELSEFVHELRHPADAYLSRTRAPLLERNPVRFWQGVSLALAVALIVAVAIAARAQASIPFETSPGTPRQLSVQRFPRARWVGQEPAPKRLARRLLYLIQVNDVLAVDWYFEKMQKAAIPNKSGRGRGADRGGPWGFPPVRAAAGSGGKR